MADRTMYVGDTFPEFKFQASDATGVLDLSTATSLAASFEGKSFTFSGAATAIQPAEADADGIHHWNAGYPFAAGDTADADTYDAYLTVTWTTGAIQTFGPVVLQVKPKS